MRKRRIKVPAKQLEFQFMSDPKFVNFNAFVVEAENNVNDRGTVFRNNTLPLNFESIMVCDPGCRASLLR